MPASRIYNPSVAGGGGGGGGVGVEAIERAVVSFAYNEASPKTIITLPATTRIVSAQIIITQSFDDAAATLTLGDSGDPDRLMEASENDPASSGEYEASRFYELPAPTTIELTINPATSTQGSGQVVIEYKQP